MRYAAIPFSAPIFAWKASSAGNAFMWTGKSGRWQSIMLKRAMSAMEMPEEQ